VTEQQPEAEPVQAEPVQAEPVPLLDDPSAEPFRRSEPSEPITRPREPDKEG
jgi:hypothetical protein